MWGIDPIATTGRGWLCLPLTHLHKGPLPVDDTLDVCHQIAEGLEAAHERGIIHRDLKPANIKITPEGKVKVLDFGLAKAIHEVPAVADLSQSPTVTEQMTRPGVILGTVAYMSPEQATGKTVDRRTDVWAFGCVLFECLMGRQAFQGDTVTEILAAILKSEPDWQALPAATSWKVKDLLHRCLQKDPKDRLHDIADARIEIMEALGRPLLGEPVAAPKFPRVWKAIALFLGLLVVGMATAIVSILLKAPSTMPVVRSKIELPAGTQLTAGAEPTGKLLTQNRTELALSPDGRYLVYSSTTEGPASKAKLYLRTMDRGQAEHIPGTEGARTPFFSPDGQWIGFWAQRRLWKVPLSGGIPSKLCDLDAFPTVGATWGSNGKIVINSMTTGGLQSVDASGGIVQSLTTPDWTREAWHCLPHFLPGGKILLFTVMPYAFGTRAHIEALSLESGKRKVLIEEGADARYVPTGHLVYIREGTLMAVPFDPERLELQGPAVPVVEGVQQAINLVYAEDNCGAGQFAVSHSGLLVYASGGIAPDAEIDLVWVDRQGKIEPIPSFGKRPVTNPRLSPDGQKLAFTSEGRDANVWVYDLARRVSTRLTNDGRAVKVSWTPDGNRVTFDFSRGGTPNLSWRRWDGSGSIERLTDPNPKYDQYPGSWSPDGRFLAFVAVDLDTSCDIYLLRMDDHQVEPFIKTKSYEGYPEFSPDGHWLAYSSNESGHIEVYVTPFPEKDRRITISNEGGREPLWARNGRELFYWDRGYTRLIAVDIVMQPAFRAGTPRPLFEYRKEHSAPIRGYDITPDGRRFLVPRRSEFKPVPVTQLNIVLNWFEELKRLAPTGKK